MTARSFEEALADSAVLNDIAKRSGATPEQVRAVLAALGNMEAEDVVRMCGTAAKDRLRAINRQTRRAKRL